MKLPNSPSRNDGNPNNLRDNAPGSPAPLKDNVDRSSKKDEKDKPEKGNDRSNIDPNSFSYGLKQQILKAWQPVPTINSTIGIFFLLSVYFIALGIVLLIYTLDVVEVSIQYDNRCSALNAPCTITFSPSSLMSPPVFIYYELDNFYQNHRLYMKSKSDYQLEGTAQSYSDAESSCTPITTVGELGINTTLDGTILSNGAVAWPCGLIAKSLFNDTFAFTDSGRSLSNLTTGIAWPDDIGTKYQRPSNYQSVEWTDTGNEHFMVWMRTAALPHFRKLWGSIREPLYSNKTYTVVITNNFPVSNFSGTKTLVLSTTNAFGGKNLFLSVSYLVVGGVAFTIFLLFLLKKYIFPSKFKEIEDKTK